MLRVKVCRLRKPRYHHTHTFSPLTDHSEDTISGLKIPAGSTVILNVWALHHDPTLQPSPSTFNPSRYASHPLPASAYTTASADRDHYGYGTGRRICPGIHLAERNLFIAMAKLLWAFDFGRARDGYGMEVPVDVDALTGYSEGFLVSAKDFKMDARVRSERRRRIIMDEFDTAEKEVFCLYDDLGLGQEGK